MNPLSFIISHGRVLPVVFSILLFQSVLSQSPGGVSGSLSGWYDGSRDVVLTGGAVSTWSDQSGSGKHATQGTATNRPAQNTTGFNYNSTILFDGQDNFLNMADQMPTTATALTAFVVARQTATNRDTYGCLLVGQTNNVGSGGGYGITSTVAGNTSFGFFVNDFGTNTTSSVTSLTTPAIMTGNWNGISAGNLQYYHSGTLSQTDNYNGQVGDAGSSYLGTGDAGNNYCFYGDMAEVVIYSVGLSATNTQKVESYLAIKYGITKPTDYLNTAGAIVYAVAAPYNNNIIGIGRDDNTVLYQKQSKNFNDTAQIFISTLAASNSANAGTFSSNNQFVMMGANTGRMVGINIERPSSIYARIEREWKVTNTGFGSTFNVLLRLHANAQGGMSTANLRLLVDADGDFTNATVYSTADGLTFTYSNPSVTISGINTTMIPTNSIRYITLASISIATPLPIELMSFEALLCNNEVCLNWKTASEKNNKWFEIERSGDAIIWEKIAQLDGAGTTSSQHQYSVIDPLPRNGINYYRLKQIDYNEAATYSEIILVKKDQATEPQVKIYPNPSDDLFILEGELSNAKIQIFNAFGQDFSSAVRIEVVNSNQIKILTSGLAEGIYYIQMKKPQITETITFKLFVKH